MGASALLAMGEICSASKEERHSRKAESEYEDQYLELPKHFLYCQPFFPF